MEHMATVRDGSDHGELVHGYWTNQVIAAEVGSDQITPLHFSLYSQASPEFTGENNQIIKAMDQVGGALDNKGIWVIDRGGDRDALYEAFASEQERFYCSPGWFQRLHLSRQIRPGLFGWHLRVDHLTKEAL